MGAVGKHMDGRLDLGGTVDITMSGGGLGRDVEMRAEQEEHASSELGSCVHECDGDTAVVRLLQRLGVVDLKHNVVILSQSKANILGQLGGLGVLGPGEHDLAAVLAHGVVGAVPGGAILGLDRDLALADDHVVSLVTRRDGFK